MDITVAYVTASLKSKQYKNRRVHGPKLRAITCHTSVETQ